MRDASAGEIPEFHFGFSGGGKASLESWEGTPEGAPTKKQHIGRGAKHQGLIENSILYALTR